MKNLIDIKRILKAIVNALHALKLLIDDIPVPEPAPTPTVAEWTHVTNTSNTVASFNMDDVTDGVSIGIKNTAGMTPVFFPKKTIEDFSGTQTFAIWGANFTDIGKLIFTVAKNEGVCTLTIQGTSTIDSTYRVWNVYIK